MSSELPLVRRDVQLVAALGLMAIALTACGLPSPPPPPTVIAVLSVEGKPAVRARVALDKPGRSPGQPLNERFGYWSGYTDSAGVFTARLKDTATVRLEVSMHPAARGPCVPVDSAFTEVDVSTWERLLHPQAGTDSLRIDFHCPFFALVNEVSALLDAASRPLAAGTVRGRMVIVANDRIDSELTFRLPDSLRARSADDAASIAVIVRSTERVGFYIGGGEARESRFVVTVVNRATMMPVAREEFVTSPPGEVDSRMGAASGVRPDGEIVQYLVRAMRSVRPSGSR